MNLQAFHNDESIKQKYLDRVRARQLADEIEKGYYWEKGKGCAVGCTIHGNNHSRYEDELGIPEWLAKVEYMLFEGMPNQRAKNWPVQFLEAIPLGANLETIKGPFLVFVLKSALEKFDHENLPDCAQSINRVIELYESRETDLSKFTRATTEAARAAAEEAEAAWTDAWAAETAYAAEAAAWAAETAYAAEAAAWTATAATWAARAAGAEWAAEHEKFADGLLRLMRECR